jgi:hypothetical protein
MSSLDNFDPTDKQAEILRTVFNFLGKGQIPSLDELKAALSYGPKVSKAAISCSLRYLRDHGAVELVYGKNHGPEKPGMKCFIKPTPAAYRRFKPIPDAEF